MTTNNTVTVDAVSTSPTPAENHLVELDDIFKPTTQENANTVNRENWDELGSMSVTGTEESVIVAAMSNIRGYHVMAIVLCCLVLAAITMCYFTWKLRYKIVLRVKDPTKPNTTVVQNLLAQTVQSVMHRGTSGPSLNSYQPLRTDVMRLVSWDPPPSLKQTDISHKPANKIKRTKQRLARQTSRSRLYRSRSTTQILRGAGGVKASRPRAKSVMGRTGYRRFSRLRSINLTSGLTVPAEVDHRILPPAEGLAGASHPLVLTKRDRTESGTSSF